MEKSRFAERRYAHYRKKQPYSLTLRPMNAELVRDWLATKGLSLSFLVDQYVEQVAVMIKKDGLMDQISEVKTAGDMLQVAGALANHFDGELKKEEIENDSTGEPDGKGKSCDAGGSGEACGRDREGTTGRRS